jgi:hypothetical protein
MNDHELTTMVCESFTGVHTTTPVEQIVSRGRTARPAADARTGRSTGCGSRGGTRRDLAPSRHSPGGQRRRYGFHGLRM